MGGLPEGGLPEGGKLPEGGILEKVGLPECGVYSVEGLTALVGSGEGAGSAPPKGEGQGGSICRFHNYDLTGGCRRNRDPTQVHPPALPEPLPHPCSLADPSP